MQLEVQHLRARATEYVGPLKFFEFHEGSRLRREQILLSRQPLVPAELTHLEYANYHQNRVLPNDKKILHSLLQHPLKYIGMMGSKHKTEEIFKQLQEEGISKEQLEKVSAPIGVKIKSNTPREIAVSIAAELINLKNTK